MRGSAESVGQETTRAVVKAIFLVIVLDALFSILFEKLGHMSVPAQSIGEPILSARGIVNRFGKQQVHDKIEPRHPARRDHRHRRRIGVGQIGAAQDAHRPASAERGQVLLNGKRIDAIGPAEKASLIGVLFQQGALFSSLSVAQNIMLPMREHTDLPPGRAGTDRGDEARACRPVGRQRHQASLRASGGMVKRAAFARALALDPRILFLDEPTSDLDPLTASGIDALIQQLNQGLGITVVIVTHDLTTLFTICGRIAVLVDKKIIVGTLAELMQSDQPWVHEFLHGPRAQGAMTARKHSHGNG